MARPIRKTSLLSVYSLLVLLTMGMVSCEKDLYRKSNDGLGYRSLGADASAWPTASATGSYRLRPVAVVSVTKE